ncbi:MAG TPA: haloacid dehalogenase type II [Rhizomicrobium sp.]|nr:haloacid dehalogenase type II [Rhizomicrobium sp.]
MRGADPTRRILVQSVAGLLAGAGALRAAPSSNPQAVKALFFDVFGTLTDWRTGVAREARELLSPLGYSLDWPAFADAWRALYLPITGEVRSRRQPYAKLDVLERRVLDKIIPQFGLTKLSEDMRQRLTLAWHHLDAWPDVNEGLTRLGRRFLLAPASNGNIALMVDIATRNHWRWDAILGADIAHDFKPNRDVYLAAADALNLAPHECMMVAAHDIDLTQGASGAGLKTAFIPRPDEYGKGHGAEKLTGPVDVIARSVPELADRLDA